MNARSLFTTALILVSLAPLAVTTHAQGTAWRYYRPSNTGIQGDYNQALWIAPNGDPYIGGYDPFFEEGGFARFVQSENRWENFSNVDHPVIGHPDDTGVARVSDIVSDATGRLWLGTWRGALSFDPAVGAASLARYDPSNSALPGGRTTDVDLAPDGTIWFAAISVSWGAGGVTRFDPASGVWTHWPLGEQHLAVQPKPGGGYFVWTGAPYYGYVQRFDSATQGWTLLPDSGPGAVAGLPGKDCVDDAGNFWALLLAQPGEIETLAYRRPDGTWIELPPATPEVNFDIWAFKAYGNARALLVDGTSRTWRWTGTGWQDLGLWKDGGAYSDSVDIDAAGNVWACGLGGAARRDAASGVWQRYRVTNTSQYDFWNRDLALDPRTGDVYACANAGPGYGGMVRFDGVRWTGINGAHYGLGIDWPFPTDNSESVATRPSIGGFAVNPVFNGIHDHDDSGWSALQALGKSTGLVEDSLGRLWSVGEYFDLRVHDGSGWTTVPIACWGSNVQVDRSRPGTVWAVASCEVVRTDGTYRFSRELQDLPELNPQHDTLTTVAAAPDGTAWLGSSAGLFHIDADSGTHQHFTSLGGLATIGASPLAVTPDGRMWFSLFAPQGGAPHGLAWWDGTSSDLFPAPLDGGPQWGGLPHAQIWGAAWRPVAGGYELWLACASRGIAVLTVATEPTGTVFCAGDGIAPHTPCPCGNASPAADEAGCLHSFGAGSTLRASGVASLAADTLVLEAASLPATSVLFLQGTLAANGGNGIVLGDGLRCVGGSLVRLGSHAATGAHGSATSSYPQAGDLPVSVRGGVIAPGTRTYQVWYRDPSAFCAGEAYNLTNGLETVWGP